MKYFFSIVVLLCLSSSPAYCESISTEFASPDKSCRIVYKGASDHGNGVFYDSSNSPMRSILKEYVRIAPQVNWISNSLVEIIFSEGSPSYHSYYYDCQEHRISPPYSLSIAIEPKTRLVATLEQEEIVFYKLFEKKEFFRAKAPGVGLTEYFDCDTETVFEDTNIFHLKMKCVDEGNVDLAIKVPK